METDLEESLSENDLVDLDLFDFVELENDQSPNSVSVCSKDDFTDEGSSIIQHEDPLDFFSVSHPVKFEGQTHGYSSPLQSLERFQNPDMCEVEQITSPLAVEEEMGEPNWLSDWDSMY